MAHYNRSSHHLAEAKIGDLNISDGSAAQNIFRLQIAMHDTHLVEVGDALHQRVDDRESLRTRVENRKEMNASSIRDRADVDTKTCLQTTIRATIQHHDDT